MDFITKLLVLRDHDLILVVCDRFSKVSPFIAITEKITVKNLAKLFRDNVWKLYRLLKNVISNKGLQFIAGLIKELNKMLGIKTKLSIAFYSQINGQTERANQELEQYSKMYINHRQNN